MSARGPAIPCSSGSPAGRAPRLRGRIFPAATSALALGLALACGSGRTPPPSPEATLVAFARALGSGDLKRAYELMSSDYRQRVSFEKFKQQLTENPQETMELSTALSRVQGDAEQTARVRYGDGEALRLTRQDDSWRIDEDLVDFYDQSTPRAALRSFVRAMERERYDVVMRLIPDADKEGITRDRMREAWSGDGREEVERMLENLRAHIDAPIEIIGNHATMLYGERMRVQFVREGEDWKIEDPK